MSDRNIIILGASAAGLGVTHSFLKNTLSALKARDGAKYHVYLINPSPDFFFRVASPRSATSTTRMPTEKIFLPLKEGLKQYSDKDFTFIQAAATGLNTSAREVSFRRKDSNTEESLPYHALVVATGSRTPEAAFSLHTDSQASIDAIKRMNEKVNAARDIILVGGGPTSVETAGEIGEYLNGKPGWFSKPVPKARITLITASNKLLPVLRPALAATAEKKLKQLGVEVMYNSRTANISDVNGRTTVTLAKGEKLEADLVIEAAGVRPNSEFLPSALLDNKGYLKTNELTLRVDEAGPRVYALGDIASYSGNGMLDINNGLPVVMVNLKRDLFSYNPQQPDAKPKGKDRELKANKSETQLVPIGSGGGVGAAFGWKFPSFLVWLIKGRDFMVGMAPGPVVSGKQYAKDIAWTAEEAAV